MSNESREIILIHGWSPSMYTQVLKKLGQTIQPSLTWSHRPQLIQALSQKFRIRYCNMPGFAGIPEPTTPYNLEDFAEYFARWKRENCPNPAFILGYSFGGAVALKHKLLTQDSVPLVLISPALERSTGVPSQVGALGKKLIPQTLLKKLKHYYQCTFSSYYRLGTPFLRESYDLIVRRRLAAELQNINNHEVMLIYGDQDKDTPWSLVKDSVENNKIRHFVISGGDHAIGQTHPQQIMDAIEGFLRT